MDQAATSLAGVRVLNLGGIWAGRVAAMLLADQGAEVVEINRPGRTARAEDALLSRGKKSVTLDLTLEADRTAAAGLAESADIVIDNLGPGRAARFKLDAPSLLARNPRLVHVSIPGFAASSPLGSASAWEGTVSASVGVYTDLHATGALLGGDPIYTAVPMASAYGGVHAAISATLGYLRRLRTGRGLAFEVPLADALMSAMALLAMRIEGQPQRFDLPAIDKAMTDVAFPILRDLSEHLTAEHRAAIGSYLKRFAKPLFSHFKCADGRLLFVNALDHVHQTRACLEVLGLLDQLICEGMVMATPYEEGGAGNNIANAGALSTHWARRMQELMAARFATRGADEWCDILQEARVPCARVRTASEWLQDPVARAGGCVAPVRVAEDQIWQAGRFVTLRSDKAQSPALAPAQSVDRFYEWPQRALSQHGGNAGGGRILDGVRVLDLSNVIAGPVSTRTLAEFGADVIRVDAPTPQAGPRMTMWFGIDVNQGKRAVILDLKSQRGQEVLATLVRQADVVVHNFLDRSLEGIGITERQLRQINPDVIWCQVSAWGGPEGGPFKDYPAFDPVLQAATGITSRYGEPGSPVMHGVASCVDYITGYCAALGIAQALVAKALGRGASSVRTSLAMGAQLVQFPFMVLGSTTGNETSGQHQKGSGAHHAMYACGAQWVFLACRPESLPAFARALEAVSTSYDALAEAIARHDVASLSRLVGTMAGASVVVVKALESVRRESMVRGDATSQIHAEGHSTPMVEFDHPCGYPVTLPVPSWSRGPQHELKRLAPAPLPGADSVAVLADAGLNPQTIDSLEAAGVVLRRWSVQKRYFPH